MVLVAIEHVQLAMPAGGEDLARGFYIDLLGLEERAKPPALAARGGCWFETGAVKLHLGVEADFRPACKAHPALLAMGSMRWRHGWWRPAAQSAPTIRSKG